MSARLISSSGPPEIFVNAQHSHNLFLELSHNFGIPLAILISIIVFRLIYKSWQYIYLENRFERKLLLEKFWFTSIIIFVFNHFADITIYDGKLSILVAVLFSGLKCILDNNKYRKDYLNS